MPVAATNGPSPAVVLKAAISHRIHEQAGLVNPDAATDSDVSGWQNPGGIATSFPTAAADPAGIHVFIRGQDGALWYRRVTGSPTGWSSLGGYLISNPAGVAQSTGGDVQVLAVGIDNRMWVRPV